MKAKFPPEIGQELRSLRKSTGQSIASVAESIGGTGPHISGIEQGKGGNPSFVIIALLAKFYGVSLDSLISAKAPIPELEERAMRHFMTVLTDKDRGIVMAMIREMVSTLAREGEFTSPTIARGVVPATLANFVCRNRDN